LAEKLDHLAAYGYEGIEFGGRGLKERVAEIVKATENHPVKPSTICAGYGGCPLDADRGQREIAMRESKELLAVAADIGAVGLIFVPIFGPPRLPDLSPLYSPVQLEKDLLTRLVEDLGAAAEKAGSLLLLEPLNRYETHLLKTLNEAVEIAERAGSPGVKIMADFFHMSIEEANIAESLRQAGPWVAHVHLADSTRLLPGYGHTDFRSGFAALREVGFDQYMALECGVPGPAEEELPKAAAYLKAQMGEA